MKKCEINELEVFEHPYEIDFSSMKSSKNDSLKAQTNKLKIINNKILDINDSNKQKNIFRNSPNLNSINSFKSLQNNNNTDFRLNENTKKNLEKYIKSKQANQQNKKIKDKIFKQNMKINKDAHKNNHNNKNIYSQINNYWENRDKKNKIKMQQIKKEREEKIYGELSQKPKISKNSKEIIERLKERNYELTEEDGYEEEINMNIPIRTKEKNYFFKTVYYSNKNKLKNKNKSKINKSVSKVNTYYEKNKLNKIQISKKRPKTPKLKRNIKTQNKKSTNKKLNFSVADIKNIELIKLIRNKEQDEKMKEIKEKIKEEENQNSPDKNIIEKNENNVELINEKDNYNMNKSMNAMTMRNYSMNILSDIMISRRFLNDIYNRDKKVINHSFTINSTSIPKSSSKNQVSKNSKNISSSNNKNSKTISKKKNLRTKSENMNKKNSKKNLTGYGLYDPNSKSLKYRHFTEISNSYNNININNDNINENEKNSDEKMVQSDNIRYSEINKNIINKKIKNNLFFEFDREIRDKKEELNQIYKDELMNRTNEIKKIEVELKERNMKNKKLIKESKVDDNDFHKIILKNQSINNQLNEINKEYLLKFREENLKRLSEIRQKENKYDRNIYSSVKNEEEKNVDDIFQKKINVMKYKTILNNEQQNIENNLELFNNELKINEQKKRALLNKIFNNEYSKSMILDNENNEYQLNLDKYLVKNDAALKENFTRKYFSTINNDNLNKTDNGDLVTNFDFQRRHHF